MKLFIILFIKYKELCDKLPG